MADSVCGFCVSNGRLFLQKKHTPVCPVCPVDVFFMCNDYKKDIFDSFAYEFELSFRMKSLLMQG